MTPELQAELENLVFAPMHPAMSLDNRLQPFLDLVARAVLAERERCAAIVDNFWSTGRASDMDALAAAIRQLS